MPSTSTDKEKTAAGTLPGDGGSARLRNEKGAAVPCAGRYARQAADRATRGERGAMGARTDGEVCCGCLTSTTYSGDRDGNDVCERPKSDRRTHSADRRPENQGRAVAGRPTDNGDGSWGAAEGKSDSGRKTGGSDSVGARPRAVLSKACRAISRQSRRADSWSVSPLGRAVTFPFPAVMSGGLFARTSALWTRRSQERNINASVAWSDRNAAGAERGRRGARSMGGHSTPRWTGVVDAVCGCPLGAGCCGTSGVVGVPSDASRCRVGFPLIARFQYWWMASSSGSVGPDAAGPVLEADSMDAPLRRTSRRMAWAIPAARDRAVGTSGGLRQSDGVTTNDSASERSASWDGSSDASGTTRLSPSTSSASGRCGAVGLGESLSPCFGSSPRSNGFGSPWRAESRQGLPASCSNSHVKLSADSCGATWTMTRAPAGRNGSSWRLTSPLISTDSTYSITTSPGRITVPGWTLTSIVREKGHISGGLLGRVRPECGPVSRHGAGFITEPVGSRVEGLAADARNALDAAARIKRDAAFTPVADGGGADTEEASKCTDPSGSFNRDIQSIDHAQVSRIVMSVSTRYVLDGNHAL